MSEARPIRFAVRIVCLTLALVLALANAPQAVLAADAEENAEGTVVTADAGSSDNLKADTAAEKEKALSAAKTAIETSLSDAGVTALPSLDEYYQTHKKPNVIAYQDFLAEVGSVADFDSAKAAAYTAAGTSVRLDTAADLYLWSLGCNSVNDNEKAWYLAGSFILGNNIEYDGGKLTDVGLIPGEDAFFRPVGTESAPFTGTLDGRGFEIRNLALDVNSAYKVNNGVAMFGCIGAGGTVKNLGIDGLSALSADQTKIGFAVLAMQNDGTLQTVYVDLTAANATEHLNTADFAGLVYTNNGTLDNAYFAGKYAAQNMEDGAQAYAKQDPVCMENNGVITNTYYDATVYNYKKTSPSSQDSATWQNPAANAAKAAAFSLWEDDLWETDDTAPQSTQTPESAAGDSADGADETAPEPTPEPATPETARGLHGLPEPANTDETTGSEQSEENSIAPEAASEAAAALLSAGEGEPSAQTDAATDIKGLTTRQLKTIGQSTKLDKGDTAVDPLSNNGEYKWHIVRKVADNTAISNIESSIQNINKYLDYPKLYGFTTEWKTYVRSGENNLDKTITNQNAFTISTPADLLYFPTSPEYSDASVARASLFHITNDIDMTWVADDAYVPSSSNFYGAVDAKAAESEKAEYNGSYSLINLRITRYAVTSSQTLPDADCTYRYGLIGCAAGYGSALPYSDTDSRRRGAVCDLNFIGGGIDTGDEEMTGNYNSSRVQLAAGMAVAYGGQNGVIYNLHSSADVTWGDGSTAVRVRIGGLFGTITLQHMENVTFTGTVNGGLHPYSADFVNNQRYIGGIAGSLSVSYGDGSTAKPYGVEMKNVVNYGNVSGAAVYGTMTEEERYTYSASYNRATGDRIGGICGSGGTTAMDLVANYGQITDVDVTWEERPTYNADGAEAGTETYPVARLPEGADEGTDDEKLYILNYDGRLGGLSGWGLLGVVGYGNDKGKTLYGYDYTSDTWAEGSQTPYRVYNFANVTCAETRRGYVAGLTPGMDNYRCVPGGQNFGRVASYAAAALVSGIGWSNDNYDRFNNCQNYGDLWAEYTGRTSRRTQYSGYSIIMVGICRTGATNCTNYGKITYTMAGYEDCANGGNETSLRITGIQYNATSANNVYPVAKQVESCTNHGDILCTTFNRWTGLYNFMDMTDPTWLYTPSGEIRYSKTSLSQVNWWTVGQGRGLWRMGVAGIDNCGGINCVNTGDITIEDVPESAFTEERYQKAGLIDTYENLKKALKEKNGFDLDTANTGIGSDTMVRRGQTYFRQIFADGISSQWDNTYSIKNSINLGKINLNAGSDIYAGGISCGNYIANEILDCVNRGDITYSGWSCENTRIVGIGRAGINVINCLNTGNLTIKDNYGHDYIGGIFYDTNNGVQNTVADCINTGDLLVQRKGQRTSAAGRTIAVGGIGIYVNAGRKAVITGCANYGGVTVDSDAERFVEIVNGQETSKDTHSTTVGSDSILVGGLFGQVNNQTGTAAHTLNMNACINQGAVTLTAKQMRRDADLRVGGAIGRLTADGGCYEGSDVTLTNLVNHGSVTAKLEEDESKNGNNSFLYTGGLIGEWVRAGSGKPCTYLLEYALNTGSVSAEGDCSKNSPEKKTIDAYTGGLVGRLNNESAYCSFQVRNVLDYQVDIQPFGWVRTAYSWYFSAGFDTEGQKAESVEIYDGNGKLQGTAYPNHLLLEDVYTARTDLTRYTLGGGNYYTDAEHTEKVNSQTVTLGVFTANPAQGGKRVSEDDETDTRTYLLVYPVTENKEGGSTVGTPFFEPGKTDSETGAVCTIEYRELVGLSDAYRAKYKAKNPGGYEYLATESAQKYETTKTSELPEGTTDTEDYIQWAEQPGGFVLRTTRTLDGAGVDYAPNQFVPGDVTVLENWYDDALKTAMQTAYAQVQVLELKELLQVELSKTADGETATTYAYRRVTDENGNGVLYVYVPTQHENDKGETVDLGLTGWKVTGVRMSTLATGKDADGGAFSTAAKAGTVVDLNAEAKTDGNGETYQAEWTGITVTAQDGTTKKWTVRFVAKTPEKKMTALSVNLLKDNRYDDDWNDASVAGTDSYNRILYTDITPEDSEALDFWDYPIYGTANNTEIKLKTSNIEDGYRLGEHEVTYYYPQNGYGITEPGKSAGLSPTNDLAAWVEEQNKDGTHSYQFNASGDLVADDGTTVLAELIYNANATNANGTTEAGGKLLNSWGALVKDTNSADFKAEKYSSNKPAFDSDTNYYTTGGRNNICWAFVTRLDANDVDPSVQSNTPVTKADALAHKNAVRKECTGENGKWSISKIYEVRCDEQAAQGGNLYGTYNLITNANWWLAGGYYEMEFTFSDNTSQSVWLALQRNYTTRLGNNYWSLTSIGYKGSEKYDEVCAGSNFSASNDYARWRNEYVQESDHDAYGAYTTWEKAAEALNTYYTNGGTAPYTLTYSVARGNENTIKNLLSPNSKLFGGSSTSFWNSYSAGFAVSGLGSAGIYTPSYTNGGKTASGENFNSKNVSLAHGYRGLWMLTAAGMRASVYKIDYNEKGQLEAMDCIIEVVAEDLVTTRYYTYHMDFPEEVTEPTSAQIYRSSTAATVPLSERKETVAGVENVVTYPTSKDETGTIAITTTYSTSSYSSPFNTVAFSANTESLFAVEYCGETDASWTTLTPATYDTNAKNYVTSMTKTVDGVATATTLSMSRASDTAFKTTFNGDATPGYYRITPVLARTEYVYLYEGVESFKAKLDAEFENVTIPGLTEKYKLEAVKDDSTAGYTYYKLTYYVPYEPVVLHKRANDDSYLKNIYMTDQENGTANLSSVNADILWDTANTIAIATGKWNSSHAQTTADNIVHYSDGEVFYNKDPLYPENDDTAIEKVNAFVAYNYITTSVRNSASETGWSTVNTAYLRMTQSCLPAQSKLYYLANPVINADGDVTAPADPNWKQIAFKEDGTLAENQTDIFKYDDLADEQTVKVGKMFKIVAENGYESYYTIYALQNRRNKAIEVLVGDYTAQNGTLTERDGQTKAQLASLLGAHENLSVQLRLMVDGEAVTSQTGWWTTGNTGADGNQYYNLKYGSYDVVLNVPETEGYTYKVYYAVDGAGQELQRSADNPNAWRLPLRFTTAIGQGKKLHLWVQIEPNAKAIWGRSTETH